MKPSRAGTEASATSIHYLGCSQEAKQHMKYTQPHHFTCMHNPPLTYHARVVEQLNFAFLLGQDHSSELLYAQRDRDLLIRPVVGPVACLVRPSCCGSKLCQHAARVIYDRVPLISCGPPDRQCLESHCPLGLEH